MIDDLCNTTIVRGLMVCVLLGQDVMSAVAKRIHITSASYIAIKRIKKYIKGWKNKNVHYLCAIFRLPEGIQIKLAACNLCK